MYANQINENEKRTVYSCDLESGELLSFAYFPAADVITINGISVTRANTSEEFREVTVFVRRPDKKLFSVATDSLAKLYI